MYFKALKHTYQKIIKYYMELSGVDKDETYAVGTSMGGMAAIYYSYKLGLNGAIVSNPQIDKDSAKYHTTNNWMKAINNSGNNFEELSYELFSGLELPNLYIEYSNYKADKVAAHKYMDIYKELDGFIVINKSKSEDHNVITNILNIESAINMFSAMNKVKKLTQDTSN